MAVPKKSLYEVLSALIRHELRATDAQTVEILATRFGNDATAGFVTELLELDGVWQVVDKGDRRECEKETDRMRSASSEASAFKASWRAQRVVVLEAARPSGSGKGNSRAKAKAKAAPRKDIPPGELSQQQLRHLCPPGGHIWKSNTGGGGWQAHFKPFRRVGFAASVWGARESALQCLRYLWEAWALMSGQSKSACPIAGLWTDAAHDVLPESRAPGAAASSSRDSQAA